MAALIGTRALANVNLMEQICDRANLNRAYKRVKSNKGSAGIDGMEVTDLSEWISRNKDALIQSLLCGDYVPQEVRKVEIPKPDGKGKRMLCIPTVVDRLVQQAILQVLSPIYDHDFSDNSFGFRPRRSAHQALKRAQSYVAEGREIVVDIDLEKFFDRVNHDILMSELSKRIKDKRLLCIIGRFLRAGIMSDGVCVNRREGMPQGGPLSPLLSNILLDMLDKELGRRGHCFCRYADDCNIYVRSQKAGERVLKSITSFLEKRLKLRVNKEKSAVAPISDRQFLGYRLLPEGKLELAPKSLKRAKDKIRQLTRRTQGNSLEAVIRRLNKYLIGWMNYFKLTDSDWRYKELDKWIRRKLRCYRLKQRKRSWSIVKYLMQLGVPACSAWSTGGSSKGWWRLSASHASHHAMKISWFNELGLISLQRRYQLLNNI